MEIHNRIRMQILLPTLIEGFPRMGVMVIGSKLRLLNFIGILTILIIRKYQARLAEFITFLKPSSMLFSN